MSTNQGSLTSKSMVGSLLSLALWFLILRLMLPTLGEERNVWPVEPTPSSVPLTATSNISLFLPLIMVNHRPVVPTIFGVQLYGDLDTSSAGLNLTREAHVYWARWPISWAEIEPVDTNPDHYRFDRYDASILNALRHNLRLIVTVQNNPSWAATYTNGPIDKVDIGEFTEFVGSLVERYDGDGQDDAPGSPVVTYWEFYNEPDGGDPLRARYGVGYWGHFGEEYARMLCAVYPVVKAANPEAKVVLGGLAYDWFEDDGGPFVREFLDDVLRAGGGDCFDVMNFHYYPPFAPEWAPYGPGMVGKASYLRQKLAQYGYEKPLVNTESGWHSNDYGHLFSTPEIQSRYVVKFFTQALAAQLDVMIWWTWVDPGSGYGANGLLTQDLQPKPAFHAYRTAAQVLGSSVFQRSLSPLGELGDLSLEGYLFKTQAGRPLYVLWSNDEVTRTVILPVTPSQLMDMYGRVLMPLDNTNENEWKNFTRITIGPNPVYVEGVP